MQHTPGHSLQSVELGEIVAFLHEWTCHLTILSSERNGLQIILKFYVSPMSLIFSPYITTGK